MLKVQIQRPDASLDVTLRLREVNADGEDIDLEDFMRFLTEVARAYGFPYVEDVAAMTTYGVTPGLEDRALWKKRLEPKGKEKKE